MYAGGKTERNGLNPGAYRPSIIYKLTSDGDTVYSKYLGYYGNARTAVCDPYGNICIGIRQQGPGSTGYYSIFLRMSPEGFIFQRDSIPQYLEMKASTIGKDSSWIIVGSKQNATNPNWLDMFFLRIQKDGTVDPIVSLNPNHPDCEANKVEQLPNGNYLVSGWVGSRVASFELDPWGITNTFHQWYQTPNLSYLSTGYVVQAGGKKFVIGAQGSPSIVGLYDSLRNNIWMKKDTGVQVAPQAMVDGSILVGYSFKPTPPTKYFQRLAEDSSTIWKISFSDSLIALGYPGSVTITSFTSFPDESAVLAGYYIWDGAGTTNTKEDPIFLRIANVGTPVSALTKPKRGTLSNETLAPWPNPSGGTLYLKQHFDKAEVHFYTVSGREVHTDTVRFGQPIDISSFAPGLYLYRAVIDGKPFSGKVMRN